MAVKIRLMRVGKKKQPTYRVVVADARSPRDGRIIETIGHYGPRQEPSHVEIDGDRALDWLRKGAQPTEQVQKLLTRHGRVGDVRVRAQAAKVDTKLQPARPRHRQGPPAREGREAGQGRRAARPRHPPATAAPSRRAAPGRRRRSRPTDAGRAEPAAERRAERGGQPTRRDDDRRGSRAEETSE